MERRVLLRQTLQLLKLPLSLLKILLLPVPPQVSLYLVNLLLKFILTDLGIPLLLSRFLLLLCGLQPRLALHAGVLGRRAVRRVNLHTDTK